MKEAVVNFGKDVLGNMFLLVFNQSGLNLPGIATIAILVGAGALLNKLL